jgi:hypothetical protein
MISRQLIRMRPRVSLADRSPALCLKSKRGAPAELIHRIEEICETRVRFGRRVHILLKRDGWAVNPKRTHRL